MAVYIVLVLIMLLLVLFSENRYSFLFKIFAILICFLFVAFNRWNYDYYGYTIAFITDDKYGITEIGYDIFVKILKLVGFKSFDSVLFFLGVFWVFTINRWRKYTNNITMVVTLFFIFPFIYFIIQVRNSFMLLFLLNAIYEYINNHKFKTILFLGLMCVFHIFGVIFVILFAFTHIWLKNRLNNNNEYFCISRYEMLKYMKNIIIFNVLSLLVGKGFIQFILPFLIKYVPRLSKMYRYTKESYSYQSLIWGGACLIFFCLYYVCLFRNNKIYITEMNKAIIFLYIFFAIFSFFISYGCFVREFNRFYRVGLVVQYLLLACMDRFISLKNRYILFMLNVVVAIFFAVVIFKNGIEFDKILLSNMLFL